MTALPAVGWEPGDPLHDETSCYPRQLIELIPQGGWADVAASWPVPTEGDDLDWLDDS